MLLSNLNANSKISHLDILVDELKKIDQNLAIAKKNEFIEKKE
jgi:hypothetical protein